MRRTWPQRFVILAALAVMVSALSAAWFTQTVYTSVKAIGRVQISGEVLFTDTAAGEPVNFLLIGVDSAYGIDPDDPVHAGRVSDGRGLYNADTIAVVRVDPATGKAWILSIPRDLVANRPGTDREYKINAMSRIGGPELLVQAISENFRIRFNHYVQLDFLAFREVVEQLNGVPVCFDRPTRDRKSHLLIETAGCHNLGGPAALAYVRSRYTEEFTDGKWKRVIVGAPDLVRIERQQEFLVLAGHRAIKRGARNIVNLSALIRSLAESVILDSELTPAELNDVAGSFTAYDPEDLLRYSLEVIEANDYTNRQGIYLGHVLRIDPNVNEKYFDIFRGVTDSPDSPQDPVAAADGV